MIRESLPRCLNVDPNAIIGEILPHFGLNTQAEIPWSIWLLENPKSPIALPGNIDLFCHDCLHLLLDRGVTPADEAFIIGFTMGNDPQTNRAHLEIFKIASRFLYPCKYRFSAGELEIFDRAVAWGRQLKTQNIHRFDFRRVLNEPISSLRSHFGIDPDDIQTLLENTNETLTGLGMLT